ncbi:MAG: glycogen debranching protein GlgX [Acidobacteria bacterium]|nr:glycogen debranching protein GlgX [Acidobacteriota bacterium]
MNPTASDNSKLALIFSKIFTIERGSPSPFGATLRPNGINFAIFSKNATAVTLVLFVTGEYEPIAQIPLDPHINRTGHVWHIFIRGLDTKIRYGYRMDMEPNPEPDLHKFNPATILVDPCAKALSGASVWGVPYHRIGDADSGWKVRKRRSLIVESYFDWGHDQPLNIPLSETILYELHVRGFTCHHSSTVQHPGTFLGLTEKIPYLKSLGVTAVELLPIIEFEELENPRTNPITGETLLNYWGYHPINFFAPKAAYAVDGHHGRQVKEFKKMVKTFHEAGIEVILDVVFNHTAEGDKPGQTFSFRGIDNSVYYMIDLETGEYINFTGCGNTINCNHPVVRDMILECLRHWVTEMHVDGFRFDLASILGRGQDGEVLANPPVLEQIAADPILANTKLIAEAWDAAGLYQVGTFPAWGRWAELNGKFRDDVRKFVKGDAGMVGTIAQRLIGSPDLYFASGRTPHHSINFITSHDGFTLADLVSYNVKHNEANGEQNRDGLDENHSWNCGVEGPTNVAEINNLRRRQMKNMAALLLLSNGVPMILAGDELGRTQQGNNNAYCQDNEISWQNWELLEKNADLFRFFRLLIQFRKRYSIFRHGKFGQVWEKGTSAEFHGPKLDFFDKSYHSRCLALHIRSARHPAGSDIPADITNTIHFYLIANMHWEGCDFQLPALTHGKSWYRIADTHLGPPDDIADDGEEIKLDPQTHYWTGPRTVVALIGK